MVDALTVLIARAIDLGEAKASVIGIQPVQLSPGVHAGSFDLATSTAEADMPEGVEQQPLSSSSSAPQSWQAAARRSELLHPVCGWVLLAAALSLGATGLLPHVALFLLVLAVAALLLGTVLPFSRHTGARSRRLCRLSWGLSVAGCVLAGPLWIWALSFGRQAGTG